MRADEAPRRCASAPVGFPYVLPGERDGRRTHHPERNAAPLGRRWVVRPQGCRTGEAIHRHHLPLPYSLECEAQLCDGLSRCSPVRRAGELFHFPSGSGWTAVGVWGAPSLFRHVLPTAASSHQWGECPARPTGCGSPRRDMTKSTPEERGGFRRFPHWTSAVISRPGAHP